MTGSFEHPYANGSRLFSTRHTFFNVLLLSLLFGCILHYPFYLSSLHLFLSWVLERYDVTDYEKKRAERTKT